MNGYVRARIDDDLKNAAAAVLETVGLSVSDIIRVVLTRIANEKQVPIGLFTPNDMTIAAMKEAVGILAKKDSRFNSMQEMFSALENTQNKG